MSDPLCLHVYKNVVSSLSNLLNCWKWLMISVWAPRKEEMQPVDEEKNVLFSKWLVLAKRQQEMQTITAQWCSLDSYMLTLSNINIKYFLSWRDKKCQVCPCSSALVLCADCTFLYDLPVLGKIPHCENWWKLSFRKKISI